MSQIVREALGKIIKTSSITTLNLKKHVVDIIFNSSWLHIYVAEIGKNTLPIYLFSREEMILGNRLIPYEVSDRMGTFLIDDKRAMEFCINADSVIRNIVKAAKKAAESEKRSITRGEIFISLQGDNYDVYETCDHYQRKSFKELGKEEVDAFILEYINSGYKIDETLEKIFISGICMWGLDPRKMKYKPHGIIIKNPKTGVTSVSARIGKNIDQVTPKTMEGYADAEGNIYYSPLHNTCEHVNFDEVLFMPDLIVQKIFGYLEQGIYRTMKGGREIVNSGCGRLTFTINPPEIVRNKDGTLNDFTPYVLDRFKNVISKLTNSASAALSRFAFVIFDTNIKAAERVEYEDEEYYEEVEMITKEIIKYLEGKFSEGIRTNEKWLNKHIPSYDKKINALLDGVNNKNLKEMWLGQADAYRHIRGHALSYAMIMCTHGLMREKLYEDEFIDMSEEEYKVLVEKNENDIIDIAELELNYICERNLKSLMNIVEATQNQTEQSIVASIEDTEPVYLKALLHAYGMCYDMDKEEFSLNDLKISFHKLNDEKRNELFGSYQFWSRLEDKLNIDKLQKPLGDLFCIDVVFKEKWYFVRNERFLDAYKQYHTLKNEESDTDNLVG